MAVAVTGSGKLASGSVDPSTISLTVPVGSTCLVVATCMRTASVSLTTQTYAGTAMTKSCTEAINGAIRCNMYHLLSPATGANNLVTDFSAANNYDIFWYALSGTPTGGNLLDPNPAPAGTTGTSAAATCAITTVLDGTMVISGVIHEGSAVMTSAGTGQTMQTFDAGVWNVAASWELLTTATTDTQTFTNAASDIWAMCSVGVKEGAAAAVELPDLVMAPVSSA